MGLLGRLARKGPVRDDLVALFRRWLPAGRILDLPSGDGEGAARLIEGGYDVEAADLRPDACRGRGIPCTRCDMTKPLPWPSATFDGVLHSEGIEHVDAQVALLAELARVLKPGGVLVVTTPNVLYLSARVNFLLSGHPRPTRWLVTSDHGYWGEAVRSGDEVYFGHVFLINAFQLRFYMTHVGLEVVGVETTRWSASSVLLAQFLYPFVWWGTKRLWSNRHAPVTPEVRRAVTREILSGAVLFGPKLIMVARKPAEAAAPGSPA